MVIAFKIQAAVIVPCNPAEKQSGSLCPAWDECELLDECGCPWNAGKVIGKCGKCLRYMKLISIRPMRLYCPTCEEVLNLPQVRVYVLNWRQFQLLVMCSPPKAWPRFLRQGKLWLWATSSQRRVDAPDLYVA